MPEKPRDYEREREAIFEALAESVAEASDAEILAEVTESNEDPKRAAERIRSVLNTAMKAYEQRRLREAQMAYERRVALLREKHYSLPGTPEARRSLFAEIMRWQPDLGAALLTVQHREVTDLTDADIETALKQLDELGVIEEFRRSIGRES
jgi:hypothetical protein